MALARYWRLVGLESYGGGQLDLSELQLYAGSTRYDSGITWVSSHAPTSGSMSQLNDSDTGTVVSWGAVTMTCPVILSIDLGTAQAIDRVDVGSGSAGKLNSLVRYILQSSTDNLTWSTEHEARGVNYPGANSVVSIAGFDASYAATNFLLRANGISGLIDESSLGQVATNFGVTASTAVARIGTTSLKFVAANSTRLQYANPSNVPWDFSGTGPWTFETWIYPTSVVSGVTIAARTTFGTNFDWALGFGTVSGSTASFTVYTNATNTILANITVTAPPVGQWSHICLERVGGTTTWYHNGVSQASWAGAYTNGGGPVSIGCVNYNNPGGFFDGYIGGMRFTRGVARYNGAFTPANDLGSPAVSFANLPVPMASPNLTTSNVFYSLPPLSIFSPDSVTPVPLYSMAPVTISSSESATLGTGAVFAMPSTTAKNVPTMPLISFYTGNGQIDGTVADYNAGGNIFRYRRVRLIDEKTGIVIGEEFSDPVTGAYAFPYLDMTRKYTVLSYDHTHSFNAVIADNLTPTAMT